MIYQYKRELLDSLFKQGVQIRFGRGDMIAKTGEYDGVWYVKKGYVKRYQIGSSGNISVQSVYGHDDIFSLTYIFTLLLDRGIYVGPETYFYEAMCPSTLYKLPGFRFKDLVDNNHAIYKELFALAGDRLSSNIHSLENISLPSSYKKVAHQLLYFARRWGIPKGSNKRTLNIPVTQQDIADILSLTRETVSMALNELARNKLIIKGHQRYIVHDIHRLEHEAFS